MGVADWCAVDVIDQRGMALPSDNRASGPQSAPPGPIVMAKDRIRDLLRANRGGAFCGGCLSAMLELDRDISALAIESLAHSWEFEREECVCSRCGKTGLVFRALPRQYHP